MNFIDEHFGCFVPIIIIALVIICSTLMNHGFNYQCAEWAKGYNAAVIKSDYGAQVCFVKMPTGKIVNRDNYKDVRVQQ